MTNKKSDIGPAGVRLKSIRLLLGYTREEFIEALGFSSTRFRNVERCTSRVSEIEYTAVLQQYPEFMRWLTVAGDISLKELRASKDTRVQLAAAKLETGLYPQDCGLESVIVE